MPKMGTRMNFFWDAFQIFFERGGKSIGTRSRKNVKYMNKVKGLLRKGITKNTFYKENGIFICVVVVNSVSLAKISCNL